MIDRFLILNVRKAFHDFGKPVKKKLEDGFTLVELMVVVAIIGLLSAVAVPNFKKYQAKAKIAEAKLQLAAIYTAESAFFADYNMYAGCLRYMGYDPDSERMNRYYAMGFDQGVDTRDLTAHASAVNSGLDSASCLRASGIYDGTGNSDPRAGRFLPGKGIGSSIAGYSIDLNETLTGMDPGGMGCNESVLASIPTGTCVGNQSNAENMVFRAFAIGIISANGTTVTTASGLTIDHNKRIHMATPGY